MAEPEPRVLEACLEAEVLREVERVGAADEPVRRVEVGGVVAPHGGELVAERLREQAVLHAAVVAPADQLVLELLVDSLRRGDPRHQRQGERHRACDDRAPHNGASRRSAAHRLRGYQARVPGVNAVRMPRDACEGPRLPLEQRPAADGPRLSERPSVSPSAERVPRRAERPDAKGSTTSNL